VIGVAQTTWNVIGVVCGFIGGVFAGWGYAIAWQERRRKDPARRTVELEGRVFTTHADDGTWQACVMDSNTVAVLGAFVTEDEAEAFGDGWVNGMEYLASVIGTPSGWSDT
jgi:hypothetical protein